MEAFWTTNGFRFTVSDVDVDRVKDLKWYGHVHNASKKPYVRRGVVIDGKKTVIYLNRMIVGAPGNLRVDHADNDTLNNTRPNLRLATHDQNNLNRCGFGLSGFKGVTLDKGKWRARITFGEATRNLGRYSDKEEAARAYDAAAFELFGEFAWLNFPEEWIKSLPDIPFP